MIAYLKGQVVLNKSFFIIINVAGVGYKIFITANSEYALNKEYELFIHQHIREEINDLYGFNNFEQLDIFEKLISVNGVGPKVAMTILTVSDHQKIVQAVISEDVTFFQSIPGIGKKVATKIILDLKTKVSGLQEINVLQKSETSEDVVDAMISLGYKRGEIIKIINQIPSELKTSEEKVRWCLKNMKN